MIKRRNGKLIVKAWTLKLFHAETILPGGSSCERRRGSPGPTVGGMGATGSQPPAGLTLIELSQALLKVAEGFPLPRGGGGDGGRVGRGRGGSEHGGG